VLEGGGRDIEGSGLPTEEQRKKHSRLLRRRQKTVVELSFVGHALLSAFDQPIKKLPLILLVRLICKRLANEGDISY